MIKSPPAPLREVSGTRAVGSWGSAVAFAGPGRARAAAPGEWAAGRLSPALYLADELGWLRGLDPLTLEDDGRELPIAHHHGDPGDPARWRLARWFVPADGARLVRLDFPMLRHELPHHAVTISIFDGPDGRAVRAIPAPAYPIGAWLSADGRRLVISKFEDSFLTGVVGPSTWHVVDLDSGSIRSTARFAGYDGDRWTWPVLDPAARTAYRLVPIPGVDPVVEGGLRLKAIDVASGAVRVAVDLPGLRISRLHLRRGDRLRQEVELGPALAVAPDGTTLALAHPDGRGVTLFDAATLAVRRRLVRRDEGGEGGRRGEKGGYASSPSSPSSPCERSAWDWPPARAAVFGPDGSRLYLAGFGPSPDPADPIASVNHALKVVDLTGGTMRRDPLNLAVAELAPAPDGSCVYVAGLRPERWGSPLLGEKAALRRLDPVTLATLADRSNVPLDEARVLLPWPA